MFDQVFVLLAQEVSEKPPPYVVGLLIAGILLVTASMMIGLRNRKQRSAKSVGARETLDRVKQRSGLKRDLEALSVDIEQMARRVGAQLDNKAARLEKLIDDADTATARLEQARENLLASPAPGAAAPQADAQPNDALDITGSRSVDSPTLPGASSLPGAGVGADRLMADTYRLADTGLSAQEIARSVDEHVGKIELILALRPGKNAGKAE